MFKFDISLKTAKILGISFLIIYFVSGLVSYTFDNHSNNIPPLFSWFLFYKVYSPEKNDYQILIHQAGNQFFNPPVFFERARGSFTPKLFMSQYNILFNNLGKSLEEGDQEKIKYYKDQLERKAIVKPIIYEISKVRYELIDRWVSGESESKTVLGKFKIL